jgi:hypothetical protein
MRALPVYVSERPWQLFGLCWPKKGRDDPTASCGLYLDQGRSRSVAPARSILRPLTRYKGRGCYTPTLSFALRGVYAALTLRRGGGGLLNARQKAIIGVGGLLAPFREERIAQPGQTYPYRHRH